MVYRTNMRCHRLQQFLIVDTRTTVTTANQFPRKENQIPSKRKTNTETDTKLLLI
jgi:hypothetical protein